MIPRSYASEEEEVDRPKWLLFAREQDGNAFVFTAVVTLQTRSFVAELSVDDDALKQHSEELGLEMDTSAFKTLLLQKALELRECVDVELETEGDAVTEVFLSLTYKFSPTISRRGLFQLPIVASDAPLSLVTLLTSVHAAPPQSMLSELQQRKKEEQREAKVAAMVRAATGDRKTSDSTGSQETKEMATASQSLDNGVATPAVNPMVLKRRHVPTGTMRRKGPRGAKLAKK